MENQPNWKIKLLYDGECPLCMREVNFLKKRDDGRGLVAFVDISADDYSPADNANIDFATAMGRIHAILPDNTIVTNIEVFRRVYDILGMGWIYSLTKLPLIGFIADLIYDIWAKLRLPLTGRPNLNIIINQRQNRLDTQKSGRCRINT